jgi:hypothetical protein
MLWLGIAVTVAGALVAASLVLRAGDKTEVLGVARPVPYGQVIADQDLTVARVPADPALRPVAASAHGQVVGKRAAVDLRPGALLTADAVTSAVVPGSNQQLVPVALKSSQLPAGGLAPQTPVQFVTTPAQNGEVSDRLPSSIRATVIHVGERGQDGTSVVDVVVSASDGPALAARAASGRIALVVDPRGQ